MTITFEGTRRGYLALWERMLVRAEKFAAADKIVARILAHRGDYEAVEKETGVPWFLVAGLHSRESSLDFSTYLGNGQPLNRVTTEVPAGRGPFASFSAGAIDALSNLKGVADWPVERIAYEAERFNGEGYFSVGINSPYLWAWSDLYSTGKFIADHQFSSTAADPQCGVMVLIKRIAAADASVAARISPAAPTPTPQQQETPVATSAPWPPPKPPTTTPPDPPIIDQTKGHIMVDVTQIENDVNIGLSVAEKMMPLLGMFLGPQVTALLSAAIQGVRTIESQLGLPSGAAVQAATAHVTPGAPNSPALSPAA